MVATIRACSSIGGRAIGRSPSILQFSRGEENPLTACRKSTVSRNAGAFQIIGKSSHLFPEAVKFSTQAGGADDQHTVGVVTAPAHTRATQPLLVLLHTAFNRAGPNR